MLGMLTGVRKTSARNKAGTRALRPHRQSRYVIRLPAILAELCRIGHE